MDIWELDLDEALEYHEQGIEWIDEVDDNDEESEDES